MKAADGADEAPGLRMTIIPRFHETDALGHINNNALGSWFEAVRARYLREVAGYRRAVDAPWVIAAISMEFARETVFEDPVSVAVRPVRLGRSSVVISGVIHQNGQVTMRGEAVMVHVDRDTGKPQPLPERVMRRLERDAAADSPPPRAPGRA